MESNQRKYIEYVRNYAETTGNHIWLGGSFLRGNPTQFSDVDISVLMGKDSLREFISGYGDPVYLSYTTNPEGIIIVIYEDGVAVDLEVIESIDVTGDSFFHMERVKDHDYCRNNTICREICERSNPPYQTARLFHRSLIKYLSGKKEVGVSVANEIASFLDSAFAVTENDYKARITRLLDLYCEKYPMDAKYRDLCSELINNRLDDSDCTIERLIEDNHKFVEGFESAGEKVLFVKGDYEKIIGEFC